MDSQYHEENEIAVLLDSFTRQKQILTNLQIEITRLEVELKKKDEAIQLSTKRNQKLSFANDDILEKIEICQETQLTLEKELNELQSSKTNMQMTHKAMDANIAEMREMQSNEVSNVTTLISQSKVSLEEQEKLFADMTQSGENYFIVIND